MKSNEWMTVALWCFCPEWPIYPRRVVYRRCAILSPQKRMKDSVWTCSNLSPCVCMLVFALSKAISVSTFIDRSQVFRAFREYLAAMNMKITALKELKSFALGRWAQSEGGSLQQRHEAAQLRLHTFSDPGRPWQIFDVSILSNSIEFSWILNCIILYRSF